MCECLGSTARWPMRSKKGGGREGLSPKNAVHDGGGQGRTESRTITTDIGPNNHKKLTIHKQGLLESSSMLEFLDKGHTPQATKRRVVGRLHGTRKQSRSFGMPTPRIQGKWQGKGLACMSN